MSDLKRPLDTPERRMLWATLAAGLMAADIKDELFFETIAERTDSMLALLDERTPVPVKPPPTPPPTTGRMVK